MKCIILFEQEWNESCDDFFNGFRIPNTVCSEVMSLNVVTEPTPMGLFHTHVYAVENGISIITLDILFNFST